MPDIEQVKNALRGPMIPVITSFKDDLSLDLDAIQDNVRSLVERGIVTGKGAMLAVGAGGDFPMLSTEERKQVAQAIVGAADGQVAVLVGVQHTDPRTCVELAQHAQKIGAYGVQASPTYYYHPSDAGYPAGSPGWWCWNISKPCQIPLPALGLAIVGVDVLALADIGDDACRCPRRIWSPCRRP